MRTLRYVTWYEDEAYIAQCLDVDIASEGDTQAEAINNLQEALELFFEGESDGMKSALPPSRVSLGELCVYA